MTVGGLYGIQDGVISRIGLPFEAVKGLYVNFMGRIDTGFPSVLQTGITVVQVFGITPLLQVFNSL